MSVVLQLRTSAALPRAALVDGPPDLRWSGAEPGESPGDGTWYAYRDRISTRLIEVTRGADALSVTIRAGACDEDCDLAVTLVRRAAAATGVTRVHADVFGDVSVDALEDVLDAAWRRSQRVSAARVAMALARERGPIQMPGPIRAVCIGPRVLAELEGVPEQARGEHLVSITRRVLWPDPRYESAGIFEATAPDGSKLHLAILLPDRACVLPHVQRLAIDDPRGVFLVPRDALHRLPVQATALDDGNDLVEAVPAARWTEVCDAARPLAARG